MYRICKPVWVNAYNLYLHKNVLRPHLIKKGALSTMFRRHWVDSSLVKRLLWIQNIRTWCGHILPTKVLTVNHSLYRWIMQWVLWTRGELSIVMSPNIHNALGRKAVNQLENKSLDRFALGIQFKIHIFIDEWIILYCTSWLWLFLLVFSARTPHEHIFYDIANHSTNINFKCVNNNKNTPNWK